MSDKIFRFGLMGAGGIATRFCTAVKQIEGCEVAAISSKSRERAEKFSAEYSVPRAFDSYVRMLDEVRPDCVYIATTPDSHFALTKLCLEAGFPVLCEKAMFVNSEQANEAFSLSERKGLFSMEALWSRFLPANRKAKEWIDSGRIGDPVHLDIAVGFVAPPDPEARYMSRKLCGGVSTDVTVYAYELARYYFDLPVVSTDIHAVRASTGVDLTNVITLGFEGGAFANLVTSFAAPLRERAVIFGTKGSILVPFPHFASEAFLYEGNSEKPCESFRDDGPDGFTHEIRETIRCVGEGKVESDTVPHRLTADCAAVFDAIYQQIGPRKE